MYCNLLYTDFIIFLFIQDFNFTGTQILSCGMDHSLKVWDMEVPVLCQAIHDSNKYQRGSKRFECPRLENTYCKFKINP